MRTKKDELTLGVRYTSEQLTEMPHYDLYTIAAALGISKRLDGKYGSKAEMIPKILKAQEQHDERTTPYCEMCGQYTMLREKAHIYSEGDNTRENILMLCISCHRMLDVHLKPRLFYALKKFGSKNLPSSWEKSIYQQAYDAVKANREKTRPKRKRLPG